MTMLDYRVLVTGSRDLNEPLLVRGELGTCLDTAAALNRRLVVVHGHCKDGPDSFADDWAREMKHHGFAVDYERHPAQNHPTQDFGPWPRCGPIRNSYMVSLDADECLAFIGPCTSPRCRRATPHGSHGASDCASKADRAGISVRRWDLWRTF